MSIIIDASLLLTPQKVLGAYGLSSYSALLRLPAFRDLMLAAPEHNQNIMWAHILATLDPTQILDEGQTHAIHLALIQSPNTFNVREVAASPESFCPEAWLRVRLLGALDRWFNNPNTLPHLRTGTGKLTAHRVARWVDDDGAAKRVFLSNGRMHSELVRLLRRACFSGMPAGQYEAIVRLDKANAVYPIPLSDPARLDLHLLNWPLVNAAGIERTVFDYVRRSKGMDNLRRVLHTFRRTPVDGQTAYVSEVAAGAALDADLSYSPLSSRERRNLSTLVSCLRAAIYAPEWLEDISDTDLTSLFQGAKHTARPAFPAGGRKLDTRRMYFAAFANARESINPYRASYVQARDSYERWAAEDLAMATAAAEKPKAFLRGLVERTAARLGLPLTTVTDVALAAAAAWLWYLVWISPRLTDTPAALEVRNLLDTLSAELAARLGVTDALLADADTLLHAPLRSLTDGPARLPVTTHVR